MGLPISYFVFAEVRMIKNIASETIVWFTLILLTLIAWILVEGQKTNIAILMIVGLSSLKVMMIGLFYIEFLKANSVFKRFYPLWVTVVALMIVLFKFLDS